MKLPSLNSMASALVVMSVAAPAAYAFELEEVVVTVNKREESLLDVAGSVSVMGAETLSDFKLDDMDAVIDFVPNATFNAAPSGTPVLAIRGIGTRAGGAMLEQDVGLFVDGVWAGRNNQLQAAMFDLDRIEVLKGTQASLYGRNTLVGAVSATTRKPGDTLEGYLSLGYEFEYDSSTLEGAISIPVTDQFSLRLAAMYEDAGGWVENQGVNRDEAQSENSAFRLTGVYNTDNDWVITAKAQVTSQEREGNSFVRLLEGSFSEYDGTDEFTPAPPPASAALGYDEVAFGTRFQVPVLTNEDIGSERDFNDFSLQIDIPIGDHTLTSVSGYSDMDYQSVFDPSILSGPRVVTWYDEDYEQFSQELRLTSPAGEAFDYIVGLYYVTQDIDRLNFQYLNDDKRFWYGEQQMDAASVFGSGTWSLSDTLRLIVGARYTDEEKEADIIVLGSNEDPDLIEAASDRVDEQTLDGSITFEWDATDTALVFAGIAKGSKKPGLASGNPVNNADFVGAESLFIPLEKIVTLEAGVKYELENGYINATIFNMDISDFQNASFTNGNLLISSFDVTSQGIEVDAFMHLSDEFSLTVGLGVMEVENDDAGPGQNAEVSGAPEFSLNSTLTYESEGLIKGFASRVSLNLNHKSAHWLNATSGAANRYNEIDAVTLLNTNLSLTHLDSGFKVALIAKNLTDEEYADFSYNAPGRNNDYMYSVAHGRTFGLEASYSF
ncbi:TonB-dependent receptor [Pseudomaricurvus alkylphenolicus]|uniref:TonB-dependent receptor n=1 Tax=Pseudomaricurvus alkylphenolicus TaxID=1306991 RepID=UPI00142437F5|nr:TonB-dependent receptor [Pseudomaricurvus alkylphenolicus]NIB43493.1 TonB-dependent receptor [Pseudomaricurvus alkylphenolicus]